MIQVHDRTFTTKKALTDFTRQSLRKRRNSYVNPGDEFYSFLSCLLKRHPNYTDKVAFGEARYLIRSNPIGEGSQTLVIGNKSEQTVFSWRSCCTGIKRSINTDLNLAMRTSIRSQIKQFSEFALKECASCNDRSGPFEVDHVVPFSTLKKKFFEIFPYRPEAYTSNDSTHEYIKFAPGEKEFEEAWQKYHRYYSRLQLLCRDCHTRKTCEN